MNKIERAPDRDGGPLRTFLVCGLSTAHFSYYSTIIAALLAHGHKVHLLYDESRKEGLGSSLSAFAAAHAHLSVGALRRRNALIRYPLMWWRELGAIASYAGRQDQSGYYIRRAARYLPPGTRWLADVPLIRRLLAKQGVRRAIAGIEPRVPAASMVSSHIATLAPDAVICSPANMHGSFELEYLKAARTLGIPTAVPVLSWDNLSTKGLLHVAPDLLLAWNRVHAEEATQIHGIPQDAVVVTGSPFFDKWFAPEGTLDIGREALLGKIGLDPSRPYVLYLGSSVNIAENETWVVEEIAESFRRAEDPSLREMQVLVRPHPANADIYRAIDSPGVKVWPLRKQLPDESEAQREFIASVRHSRLCVGINTSGMIDAVVHDHPVVALILDRYQRTQSETTHFQHLMHAGCLYEARCFQVLVRLAAELKTREDDSLKEKRAAFVDSFIRPQGRGALAGDIAAWCIERLGDGTPVPKIKDELPSFLAVLTQR